MHEAGKLPRLGGKYRAGPVHSVKGVEACEQPLYCVRGPASVAVTELPSRCGHSKMCAARCSGVRYPPHRIVPRDVHLASIGTPPGDVFARPSWAVAYDRHMLRKGARRVYAQVVSDGWSTAVQRTVTDSLHGQVSAVGLPEDRTEDHGDLLVVTAPVVFAPGAVRALTRSATSPGRVVTRVMMPGGGPTDVALWSAAWLSRHSVDLQQLPELGLEFDRVHLPHGDPQARAWVRADEVGIALLAPDTAETRRWALVEGLRLWGRRATSSVRSALGQVRRTRALARQRRRHFRG